MTTSAEHARIPDLVLPLAYPFPDMGKLLSLVFVVFAAWFYDRSLHLQDFPEMLSIELFLSFGKLITAIPFLLDLYHIPDDIFNLFIAVGVICGRVADVAGAMHLMTFAILTMALMTGAFKVKWRLLLRGLLLSLLFFLVAGLAVRAYLEGQMDRSSSIPQILQMQLLNDRVPHTVSSLSQPNPVDI